MVDIASSQTQVIFMPPVHFSILNVQRGTIIQFGDVGMVGMVGIMQSGTAARNSFLREPGI